MHRCKRIEDDPGIKSTAESHTHAQRANETTTGNTPSGLWSKEYEMDGGRRERSPRMCSSATSHVVVMATLAIGHVLSCVGRPSTSHGRRTSGALPLTWAPCVSILALRAPNWMARFGKEAAYVRPSERAKQRSKCLSPNSWSCSKHAFA